MKLYEIAKKFEFLHCRQQRIPAAGGGAGCGELRVSESKNEEARMNENLERLLLLICFRSEDGIGVDVAGEFAAEAAYILGFSSDQVRDGLAELHRLEFVYNHATPAAGAWADWIELTKAGGDQALQTLDRIGGLAS